jgi:hypothetical protein
MLTRLAATAAGIILCAALAVVLTPAAATADCEVIAGVAYCEADDEIQQRGSGNNNDNNGGNSPPNNGCQNQGNGVPGQGCTEGAPAAPEVASIDLAWQARGLLGPPTPTIHWSPEPRSYVRLRTGLWVEPGDFAGLRTDPPITAGEQTVTAIATPKHVEWNLVEKTIRCSTAGSPDGTECGYTYQRSSAGRPGGEYQITATVVWSVAWTCEGDCDPGAGGPLDDITASSTALLPVDEIQTESQPG